MTHEDLSAKVLEKIKEEKLKPRAKWHFIAREVVIVAAGAALLLVGSISFSTMVHRFQYNDYGLYAHKGPDLAVFVLATIPYFWIVATAAFLALLYYILKNTKKGYKYRLPVIVVLSVIGSLILGGVLFAIGVGRQTDRMMNQHMPGYGKMVDHGRGFWINPEDGLLAGEIIEMSPEEAWLVVDLHGEQWFVYISEAEIVLFDGLSEVLAGHKCMMTGEMLKEGEFEAEQVHVRDLSGRSLGFRPCCE